MKKPFAESCEENKAPILEVLKSLFADRCHVLEIGSGTGQHAVHFGAALPHLRWQTSEMVENHPGIQAWLDEAGLDNVQPPLALDVSRDDWPQTRFDAAYSANTVHIMSWPMVEAMFAGLGRVLLPGGVFALYGPFHYGGQATAESNVRFDQWLRARDPLSGVRDFDDLNALAELAGMKCQEDVAMPANNHILVWCKG
ncbi:MAG: DUF938 domain-containing protein [Gammaproteobacteria bacterium]|nr:DUF938 domain-containing protein [Gammaproteobacteria bacterium]MCP5137093.1 DUF938 domain-containing protein [Gammaproteobacteria bacterium]